MPKRRRMARLYKEGLTYEMIGERFGITKQRVHQLIVDLVGLSNKRKRDDTFVAEVRRRCKAGESQHEIGIAMGVTKNVICGIRKRHKIPSHRRRPR